MPDPPDPPHPPDPASRRGGPHPAVAAVRSAVRAGLADLAAAATGSAGPGPLVLVACSGGPDSLALAAATAYVAPRAGLRAGAVVVDHDLQPGSGDAAREAATACCDLGLHPVDVTVVRVAPAGGGGPEARARDARHDALAAAATGHGAVAVLLGHTRDDQAETVLMRLARGSGARSLAGIAPRSGVLRRPLLGLGRADTEAACATLGLVPWRDPTNTDRTQTRSRVRHGALPALRDAVGPAAAAGLARSADLLREDADALDDLAADLATALGVPPGPGGGSALGVAGLARAPAALRMRVLRTAALAAGTPGGALSRRHTEALDALVTRWRGQGPVHLPGGVLGWRRCGTLVLQRPGVPAGADP